MFEYHEIEECVEVCPTGMRSVPSETGGMKCETCDGYYCKGILYEYNSTDYNNVVIILI